MMSIKIQSNKKSLAKLSPIFLVFLVSYSIFLVKTNSQSEDASNDFGYVFLMFSIIVIVLTVLVITKNPVSDFLLKNYKVIVVALIILFILIYFIPQIPLKSITGLFVVPPTTTTISRIEEEVLTGLIQTFSEMRPGKINSMKISEVGISLTELDLEVYNKINDVRIVVSKLSSKPTSAIQDPPGNIYQYLKIEKTKIKDEDLKKVTIKFKVEKSWINENEIDESTISLNRYQDNVWVGLSTAKTGEDDEFSYYETYTSSLSFFAITGISKLQAVTTTTTTIVTTTLTTTPGTTTITIPKNLDQLKWKEEVEKRGLRVIFNESMVSIEKGNIEIRFEEFIESNIDWNKIVEATDANKTAINEFLSQKNSKLRDFVWVESNDFLKLGKYKARIILPSTYRNVFVCEGTKDNPECSILQTCGSRPCYLQQYGKTHVLLDHFSGAGGGDSEALAQPYDCDDADVNCTETTVTLSYPDRSAMTINYQKPVNFFDETSNTYQQINQTIVELPSNHPLYSYGYRYGTEKGIYKVYFKPDMGQDWEIGLNVSNIILRYDLQRTAYLDYSNMNYHILQTPSTDSVDLSVNEMNHTGVFTGVNFQYIYLPQKLKENLILNQTFRDNAPDPRNFGMQPATTYLIAEAEFDYHDLTLYVDDTEQTGNFTTENKIEFKDALGNVKFFLPIGYAVDSQVNDLGIPNNTQKVRWRIEHRGGKHYLLYGVPVLWLNSAQYPVTIDPTGEIPFTQEIDHYSLQNDLNDYYFNATDAQQMINDFQDYWSKNEICIGFYINRWREYCTDAVDWTWYNSTDYSSYVNLTGVAEAFYGKDWYQKTSKYGVRVTLEHYLTSDSPEIRLDIKLENIGQNDITDTYIKIWADDIRVNATTENDTFRVNTTSFWEPWSGFDEYWLNESLNLIYTQNDLVSRKFAVFDNSTESWVELEWNDSYWKNGISNSMNYNLSVKKESETNAPVDLVLLTGQFNKNDVIFTNFKWADAVKQNFTEANETYNEILDWFKTLNLTKYVQGEEKIEGHNITIIVNDNGRVNVSIEHEIYNENVTKIGFFEDIAWKFNLFTFRKADGFDTTRYPENKTNTESIFRYFAAQELQLDPRTYSPGIVKSYSIPYLLIDNQNGSLEDYKLTPGSDFDIETIKKSRVKFSSVFDISLPYELKTEFSVIFDYTGTSHCIRFGVFRYHPLNISVTMPSNIDNYTLPTTLTLVSTTGPTLVAKRVFPVPETDEFIQEVKVCSI